MNLFNKIAVIGGSGKAGKYLVNELILQGYSVKLLLRNPDKFEIKNPLVQVIKGDITDFNSVQNLISGCDAVISALGQTKGDKPVFSLAATNIVKAMNEAKISRYIVITGLSIDVPSDKKGFRTKILSKIMKLSFPAIIADKQNEYKIISESNLDWTVVRLPLIKPIENLGIVKKSLADCPGKEISTSDLAKFLVSQLADKTYIQLSPFIAN